MRFFGLTPEAIQARARPGERPVERTLGAAMGQAALGFGGVSVLAYSIWAYRLIPGEGAMYAVIALVYLGLGGVVLGRLLPGPGSAGRFALLFVVAFGAYAALWCAAWFGLRGKHHADLWGAAAGLAAMTWLLRRALGASEGGGTAWAVLFTCHTLGYTLGEEAHGLLRGVTGRLLWGLGHGLGFGAGLGYLLHRFQSPLRSGGREKGGPDA
ncbi:MAG: hypothetical protein HZC55_26000 [Verrucomicrobia bacterium]|nr:hypothetical protein [Verrucomicrobiota bacterium]